MALVYQCDGCGKQGPIVAGVYVAHADAAHACSVACKTVVESNKGITLFLA